MVGAWKIDGMSSQVGKEVNEVRLDAPEKPMMPRVGSFITAQGIACLLCLLPLRFRIDQSLTIGRNGDESDRTIIVPCQAADHKLPVAQKMFYYCKVCPERES